MSLQKIEIPAGWHKSLSNHDYHASSGASSSFLKKFLEQTPFKIEYDIFNKERKTNAAFDLGTAVHTLVLEPEKFKETIAIRPELNLRTNAGKAELEAFEKSANGKTIITHGQLIDAREMAFSLLSHRIAGPLLDGAIAEQSIYWHQELDTGAYELCKVRPDALCMHKPLILDVKTCESAAYDAMRAAITKYRYHLSAAMYLQGVNQCGDLLHHLQRDQFEGFCLLCVESSAPYQVACYEIGIDLLLIGRSQFFLALDRFHHANANGWNPYPDVLRVIDAPKWNPTPPII